jgi:hypothetical protein
MATIAGILDRIEGTTGGESKNVNVDIVTDMPLNMTASQRFLAIMEEYEARQTPESIAVKDLDLLDMIIQAEEYELEHHDINLQEFFDGTGVERFQTPWLQKLAAEVHRQHAARVTARPADEDIKKVDRHVHSIAKSPNEDKHKRPTTTYDDTLSATDAAFVKEFSATSGKAISIDDIRQVVSALRKNDIDNQV